ncbi:RmlC-like jelly roll fold [Sesbania bispinosa]|nr:RmlC-like jelly roll fold [Sesbania bispinosa]
MEDPHNYKDDELVLGHRLSQSANSHMEPKFQNFTSERQGDSISIPMNSICCHGNDTNILGYCNSLLNERRTVTEANGNVNSYFQQNQGASRWERSGKFSSVNGGNRNGWLGDKNSVKNGHLSGVVGMRYDSYSTTCPRHCDHRANQATNSKILHLVNPQFHNIHNGDAKSLVTRISSFLCLHIPGVISPHAEAVQQWNRFFVIACLVAIFVDPLFFFMLSAIKDSKCIVIDSATSPTTIAIVIFRSMTDVIYFLHILLQFRLAFVAPESRVVGAGEVVEHPKKIALNYLSGYFLIDIFNVMPVPQRVNQCLRDACHSSNFESCMRFIDCGNGNARDSFLVDPMWSIWINDANGSACFQKDGFPYGIYSEAVGLTTINDRPFTKNMSIHCFGDSSTLAGNLVPSNFIWEVLFTMAIIGLGLLLFALLIGNMQNFLQALGQRRLEMSLRQRDYEQWMSHRCLPEELRRQVRNAERYNWVATRGVNEEMLLENLPEELQRDIRRHLFKFVKKVRIFSMMDDQVIDAICERLKLKIFIEESKILYPGGPIDKMIFIIRGKVESIEDKTTICLSEGDFCGEELLTWCLEHYSVNRNGRKVRITGQRLLSNRTVRCLTNVEAFVLQVSDLEGVTSLYARFLRNQHVQGAIR